MLHISLISVPILIRFGILSIPALSCLLCLFLLPVQYSAIVLPQSPPATPSFYYTLLPTRLPSFSLPSYLHRNISSAANSSSNKIPTLMADTESTSEVVDFELYRYEPSMILAVVFIVLFLTVTALHTYQLIRTKSWSLIPLVIGGHSKSASSYAPANLQTVVAARNVYLD